MKLLIEARKLPVESDKVTHSYMGATLLCM